ncbi:MAG: carbohydrate ABC transporter permease [Thermomicrobiales bacterium]
MLFPLIGRQQRGVRIAWWSIVALLCLGIFLHLVPIYVVFMTSLKTAAEVLTFPPTWIPQEPTLAAWQLAVNLNYSDNPAALLLLDRPLYVFFLNSAFIAAFTLLIGIPMTSFAAYANSKLQRGAIARWSFIFFIGTLMMPIALTLIPRYLLTRNWPFALPETPLIPGSETVFPIVRIWDTPWAVILPTAFSAFNFLLFKGFFDTIPDSVIQAARVDGGSEFNIFRRIVLPMSIPVYAVAVWSMFAATWDEFLWPLIVFQTPDRFPMSAEIWLLLDKFLGAGTTNAQAAAAKARQMQQIMNAGLSWNGLMVLALLQSLPIFVVFIVCREYLLKGIRIRGLK